MRSTSGRIAIPLSGTRGLLAYRRDKVGFLLRLMAESADIAETRIGNTRVVLAVHPREVHEVLVNQSRRYRQARTYAALRPFLGSGLVTSDGDEWRRQRRRAVAALHGLDLAPSFTAGGTEIAESIDAAVASNAPLNVLDAMREWSLALAQHMVLGGTRPLDRQAFRRDFDIAYRHVIRDIERTVRQPQWTRPRTASRFRAAHERLDAAVVEAMRRDGGEDLAAKLAHAGPVTSGDVLTLLLTAYETTAAALAWALLLLAREPAAWERLAAEVRDLPHDPEIGDLDTLAFTRAVVYESLRLQPPIWAVGREAIVEHELGGITVRPGTKVAVAPYCTHRHPQFWPRPEEFEPERFLAGGFAPAAFLPFGLGAHRCIGEAVAIPAMVLVLALVARRTDIIAYPYGGRPHAGVILRPPTSARIRLATRTRAVAVTPR